MFKSPLESGSLIAVEIHEIIMLFFSSYFSIASAVIVDAAADHTACSTDYLYVIIKLTHVSYKKILV